jgi:hypothetical protein
LKSSSSSLNGASPPLVLVSLGARSIFMQTSFVGISHCNMWLVWMGLAKVGILKKDFLQICPYILDEM